GSDDPAALRAEVVCNHIGERSGRGGRSHSDSLSGLRLELVALPHKLEPSPAHTTSSSSTSTWSPMPVGSRGGLLTSSVFCVPPLGVHSTRSASRMSCEAWNHPVYRVRPVTRANSTASALRDAWISHRTPVVEVAPSDAAVYVTRTPTASTDHSTSTGATDSPMPMHS